MASFPILSSALMKSLPPAVQQALACVVELTFGQTPHLIIIYRKRTKFSTTINSQEFSDSPEGVMVKEGLDYVSSCRNGL